MEFRSSNTALNRDSVADLSQIRVVDIDARISKDIGSVPAEKMAAIDAAITDSLGVERYLLEKITGPCLDA